MNCKNSYKHVQNKDFLYWYMDTLLLVLPLKKISKNFFLDFLKKIRFLSGSTKYCDKNCCFQCTFDGII